jgi:hypothetical protein
MRRIRQNLSALFGSIGLPSASTLACWACAALAYRIYPLTGRGGYEGAARAAFVFCLPVLFLAYWLGEGALAFIIDAKRSCLPGAQRLVRRATLPALVLLLPTFVPPIATLAGTPAWWAWAPTGLVLAVAVAGVLTPRIPVSATALILLIILAAYWVASGRTGHGRDTELFFLLLIASLALPAVAKWHRAVLQGAPPHPPTACASPVHSNRPWRMAPARTGSELAQFFESPPCHSHHSNLPGRSVPAPADAAADRGHRIPGPLGAGRYRPAVARRNGVGLDHQRIDTCCNRAGIG